MSGQFSLTVCPKIIENLWYFHVFREYRKEKLALNGLWTATISYDEYQNKQEQSNNEPPL